MTGLAVLQADVAAVAAVDTVDVANKLDNSAGAGTNDTVNVSPSVHPQGFMRFFSPAILRFAGRNCPRYVHTFADLHGLINTVVGGIFKVKLQDQ